MAKMIPSEIDPNTESTGERRVFDRLKNDPGASDWTVLHSLGLANRGKKKPFGEIDFVVLIPGKGVICLEVKSGRVKCTDGIWTTTNRFGKTDTLKRSPFLQAQDGMFALRKAIGKKFGEGSDEHQCPTGYGVVFDSVPCPPITPEFERTDVIDKDDLRYPISRALLRLAKNQAGMNLSDNTVSQKALGSIQKYLRPDFDLVVAKSTRIGRTEEVLLKLTEEQYSRLDELEDNPRCLFEGAAGTGKTVLAVEYARRSAGGKGGQTLLVCFNRLLGRWMRNESPVAQTGGLVTGSFHSLLRERIQQSDLAHELSGAENAESASAIFDNVIPALGELVIDDSGERFDTIVVDEVQDLMRPEILNVLDRWLTGGISGGNWALFGDFTRQALFGAPAEGLKDLDDRCPYFTRAKLMHNCRNTRRIASETAYLSGFSQLPYVLHTVEGVPVEYHYWNKKHDRTKQIETSIERLKSGGVKASDIVILGTRKLSNSSLSSTETLAGHPVHDATDWRSGRKPDDGIIYATVHSYKGLESPVVLVVDVDDVALEESQALLYVAMSRARSSLALFISESARSNVDSKIREGMLRELNG